MTIKFDVSARVKVTTVTYFDTLSSIKDLSNIAMLKGGMLEQVLILSFRFLS